MKKLLIATSFSVLALTAQERTIHLQPFAGAGISVSRANGTESFVTTAGTAVIVPITKKFFLRPVIGAGKSFPLNPPKPTVSVPILQFGSLIGYRATKRTAVLSGFIETIQFPKAGANVYLPTFVASTATRIHGHWGIYTPFVINARSYGLSLQLGYTW